MPLPIIANTVRCAVRAQNPNGRQQVNVVHARKTIGPIDSAAISALHGVLKRLWMGPNYAAPGGSVHIYVKNTFTFQDVTYTPLDGISPSTVLAITQAGLATDESLPHNVALVMSLRTGKRGRRYRGRIYLGGFTELYNSASGVPSSSLIQALESQASQWLTDLGSVNWELVVASYVAPAEANKVVTATVNGRWDTQKKRLGR